jgi:phage protein D
MAATDLVNIRPRVEVNGPLKPDLESLLEQVVVDDHLHLPDMFLLSFRDPNRDVVDRLHAKIGSKVKVSCAEPGKDSPNLLIDGEVTALEAEYGATGSRTVLRGYDQSHRLHVGRVTETYQNVKDSDLARTVAQRAKLPAGQIDDSQTTHDHVSQVNLSDWDFLKARSVEIGFELAVSEGKLHFRKPQPSKDGPKEGNFRSRNPLQLVFGQDLLQFHPRVSSAEQVSQVKVRGWSPKDKKEVIGSASAGTTSAKLRETPAQLAGKFAPRTFTLVDRPLATQREVDAAAKAVAEQIGSAHAEAEGVARGNPVLKAGVPVSVGLVSADFEGQYTITHSRHVFDHNGYRTLFEVSGRQDRSLLGLVNSGSVNGGGSAGGPPIYGVVVAIVTDNNDPEKLGRVKLKFPWLSDNYQSDWARMTQVGAGPDSGLCFIPEVNDEVLVAFEFGDVRRPIVLSALHNGKDKPRLGDGLLDNGKVKRRGVVSRKGHRVVLLDDPGKSGIALITSNGQIKISLNETKNEIHIACQGKIRIEASQDLTLKSDQGVSIQAGTQLQLKGGTGAKLEGGPQVEISGTLVKLN